MRLLASLLLIACSRKLPDLQSPTPPLVIAEQAPATPRLIVEDAATRDATYTLQVANPCADCTYQLNGGNLAQWTDADALTFQLEPDRTNRLGLRARGRNGLLSGDVFLSVRQDSVAPQPPTDVQVQLVGDEAVVTWTPSVSDDVVRYDLAYNGNFATEGSSPIELPPNKRAFHMRSLPPGITVQLTLTAVDEVGHASSTVVVGSVTAAGDPLPELLGEVAASGIRAIDVRGNLALVVSERAGATAVETYDVATLSRLSANNVSELVSASCAGAGALKQAQLFDRYALVADGNGQFLSFDLAMNTGGALLATFGCAMGFALTWPYLWLADGVAKGTGTYFADSTTGTIDAYRLRLGGPSGDQLDSSISATRIACGGSASPDLPGYGDTAQRVVVGGNGGREFGETLYMQTLYDTFAITLTGPPHAYYDGLNEAATCRGFVSSQAHGGAGFSGDGILFDGDRLFVAQSPAPSGSIPISPLGAPVIQIYGSQGAFAASGVLQEVAPVSALAANGRYLAVARSSGDVAIIDVLNPSRPVTKFALPTRGPARGVAFAGSLLLLADDGGLSTWRLPTAPSMAVAYRAATSTIAISGGRGLITEDTSIVSNSRQATLPLARFTGAAVHAALYDNEDACVYADGGPDRWACAARSPTGSTLKPCIVSTLGERPSMPLHCLDGTDVRSIALAGSEVLFTDGTPYFHAANIGDYFSSDDGITHSSAYSFSPASTTSSVGRVALPAQPVSGATLAHAPGLAAVAHAQGVSLVNRRDRRNVSLVRTHAGLRGAVLGASDLCGVQFSGGSARIVCFDTVTGTQTQSVSIGASTCNEAAIARAGDRFAVSLIDTTGAHASCEGVWYDGTFVAEDTAAPSIAIGFDAIYASCRQGWCRFSLMEDSL